MEHTIKCNYVDLDMFEAMLHCAHALRLDTTKEDSTKRLKEESKK